MKRPAWAFYFVQGLTLGRIPLIFLFLLISLLAPKPMSSTWFSVAFGAMILSALTDLVDGWCARRFNVESRLGAYMDPFTDKIFYLTTLPTLVYLAARSGERGHAQLLLGLTVLFLIRDQWVSFLRSIGALHNVDSRANWSGKVRTLISFPVICIVYYDLQAPGHWLLQLPAAFVRAAEIASLAINVLSIWVYTRYYVPVLRKELRPPEPGASPGPPSGAAPERGPGTTDAGEEASR